eukprot:364100-Chlamydomonas_euryale.AAC.6
MQAYLCSAGQHARTCQPFRVDGVGHCPVHGRQQRGGSAKTRESGHGAFNLQASSAAPCSPSHHKQLQNFNFFCADQDNQRGHGAAGRKGEVGRMYPIKGQLDTSIQRERGKAAMANPLNRALCSYSAHILALLEEVNQPQHVGGNDSRPTHVLNSIPANQNVTYHHAVSGSYVQRPMQPLPTMPHPLTTYAAAANYLLHMHVDHHK